MSGTFIAVNGGDEESLSLPLLNHQSNLLLRRNASNVTSQVAIVGSNRCPIESLNYEIIENDFFKQDWRSRSKIQIILLGFFNNLAVENIAGMKFFVTSYMMLENKYVAAFFVFAASNFGLTLFACLITAFVAPEAVGSGIPEVKAYLNGVDSPAIFSLNYRDRRDLVTCGSAAGIAAAFRAPGGGVLFALEEMASWWGSALLWRSFFTTAVVAIVLRDLIDVYFYSFVLC